MRLIDADAFNAELRKLYREAGWDLREVHYSQLDMECNIDMMPTIEAVPLADYKSMEHTVYKLTDALHSPRHVNCPNCGKGYYILDNRVIGVLPQKTGNISRAILLDQIYAQFPADNKTATQIIGIIESMPRESEHNDT